MADLLLLFSKVNTVLRFSKNLQKFIIKVNLFYKTSNLIRISNCFFLCPFFLVKKKKISKQMLIK